MPFKEGLCMTTLILRGSPKRWNGVQGRVRDGLCSRSIPSNNNGKSKQSLFPSASVLNKRNSRSRSDNCAIWAAASTAQVKRLLNGRRQKHLSLRPSSVAGYVLRVWKYEDSAWTYACWIVCATGPCLSDCARTHHDSARQIPGFFTRMSAQRSMASTAVVR